MESLKINIPKGFKVENFDQTTGEITFAEIPKCIREQLQGWDDVLAFHQMTQQEFDKWSEGRRPHEVGNLEEEMIVAAYNGRQLADPLPDFTDGTWKYSPYFVMGSPSGAGFSYYGYDDWSAYSSVGSRLVFFGPEARANMLDAVKKFLPQYQRSRTL